MSKLSVSLSKDESISGFAYLIFQTIFLPSLIALAAAALPVSIGLAEANFLYYCVNFLAIILIFRNFLLQNLDWAVAGPGRLCLTVLFGMGRYLVFTTLVNSLLLMLDPEFINANDATVAEMVQSDLPLMALGTIVLVPVAEETLFRGLIFRNLYDKHKALAYLLSIAAFSFVHLLGFLTVYTPLELLVAFLQYLPAGLCLAWAYTRADTIFAPILLHALVNAMGVWSMRLQ